MSAPAEALLGWVRLEISSADIPAMLRTMEKAKISCYDVHYIAPLTVTLRIRPWNEAEALHILQGRNDSYKVLERMGILHYMRDSLARAPFAAALLLITMFILSLSQRVLFLRVEGNSGIPAQELLEAASRCGLQFCAKASLVRSEQVKNLLLEEIPELQWAGVNFYGSVATLTVRERGRAGVVRPRDVSSDIIAARDGIIVSASVLEGERLCREGQAVREGEVLVSGIQSDAFKPSWKHAEAEIYAITRRSVSAVCPDYSMSKVYTGGSRHIFSVLLGRKRINLSINSGISYDTCDKMYLRKYVTLPGGFQLPIGIEVISCLEYRLEELPLTEANAEAVLSDYALRDTEAQMLAGEILCEDYQLAQGDLCYMLDITYTCREMIARQRPLYFYEGEHTNDGTYHKRRTG